MWRIYIECFLLSNSEKNDTLKLGEHRHIANIIYDTIYYIIEPRHKRQVTIVIFNEKIYILYEL